MNYYVKEINSCESKIMDKIDIIKRYGISVAKYEKELHDILSQSYDDITTISSDGRALALMQKETVNMDILNKLKKLEEELDSYENYLKIYFKNNSLVKEIDDVKNINEEKIKIYVKEAKSLLEEIENINIDSVNESKKIIKDIYDTVYKIIKLELIMNGTSKVLKCIILGNRGSEYINDLVREDLDILEKDGLLDLEIVKLIDELSCEGINYTYANDKLILLLALKDKDLVLSKFNNQFSLYEDKINSLREDIIKAKDNRSLELHNLNKYKNKRNKSRNKAIIGSILLALNLASYKVMPSFLKSWNTTTTYKITRQAYDTISDEVRSEEGDFVLKKEDEYAELRLYGDVDEYGKRELHICKFKDKELDDIKEYCHMIKDNLDDYSITKSTISYRFSEQLSKEEYIVVERMTYGQEKKEFDEEEYLKDLQRALIIIYSLGGIFTTSMLTYLLISIHNNKKYKEELHEFSYYDGKIDKSEHKIEYYEKLKNELIELKKDYMTDQFNIDDYKKVLRK